MRAYTVDEIDRMRRAVRFRWLYGMKESERVPGRQLMSVVYTGNECSKAVEEELRTYMLAGISPEELE